MSTWQKGQVRRRFRSYTSGEPDYETMTPGLLCGPFGLIKSQASFAPWMLIEQATGRLIDSFRLKCNAMECARIIAPYWGDDGHFVKERANDLWVDIKATLTHYGHASRRVLDIKLVERQEQCAVSMHTEVINAAEQAKARSAEQAKAQRDYNECWRQWDRLTAFVASHGMSAGPNSFLVTSGTYQSVQALITLDPMRRRSTLDDAVCGLAHVLCMNKEDIYAKIKEEVHHG